MAAAKTERTQERAENEVLAGKLLELRQYVDDLEKRQLKALGELRGEFARATTRLDQLATKVDDAMVEWERKSRTMDNQLREAGEMLTKAGSTARRIEDRVKVLDELREAAEDPRELLKPLRRELATLRSDFESATRHANDKIAALTPKDMSRAWEHRGDLPAAVGNRR